MESKQDVTTNELQFEHTQMPPVKSHLDDTLLEEFEDKLATSTSNRRQDLNINCYLIDDNDEAEMEVFGMIDKLSL
jgi:hypothetical protein